MNDIALDLLFSLAVLGLVRWLYIPKRAHPTRGPWGAAFRFTCELLWPPLLIIGLIVWGMMLFEIEQATRAIGRAAAIPLFFAVIVPAYLRARRIISTPKGVHA